MIRTCADQTVCAVALNIHYTVMLSHKRKEKRQYGNFSYRDSCLTQNPQFVFPL